MAWRGACKPAHYNLDYSRFSSFDKDDEDEPPVNLMQQAAQNPNLPPELREAFYLSQVAKQTGDAEKQKRADELVRTAILKGGPEIQKRFTQTLDEMQKTPEFEQKAQELQGKGLQMPTAEQFLADGSGMPSGDFKSEMERKLRGTQSALENLLAQQSQLEAIAQSQDPTQIEGFFKSMGWSEQQVQRALQDKEYAMELFSSKLPGLVTDNVDELAERATEECDAMLGAIGEAKSLAGIAGDAAAAPSPAPAAATFRVQREGAEEVVVISFPSTVKSMADVELDVAPGILRATGAFAPVIVPLPDDVDTTSVQAARFSKKRSELTVRLTVK